MDNTGCYINRFCLSWTILVGKSPCFVCREQYWLLYIPGLCAMNKTGWYITRICPLWTIMVGISPRFFFRGQKLVGISTGFVCRRQKKLVYQPVLSVVDNIGWYISRMCLAWTILVGKSTVFFSFMDSNGWFISTFCLSWTILVGISPYVVCDEQKWLVYHPVLSVMDSNGWYIS